MLDSLITSKTRIKLLLKFFLNSTQKAYLRGLANEFGESTNAIRLELNHMENAGLLSSLTEGNKKLYQANPKHPLFDDIRSLVLKHSGITQIIDEIITQIGDINKVWITGDFAIGKDSEMINLIISGENINRDYLLYLSKKTEQIINRKISYNFIKPSEETEAIKYDNNFLVWKFN